jgi:tryptophan synthase beta chain
MKHTSYRQTVLDSSGRFGEFGGCYVPETLMPVMQDLQKAFFEVQKDPNFLNDLKNLYAQYSGRATALFFAENLTKKLGGAKIYIKNEGLNHTGAHKMNHCLGQVLLAKRMGKTRIIAETGAGQHGVATASVCAKFGLKCVIYMGKKDYERQRPNVFWMERVGAEVIPVLEGEQTLRDAVNAGLRDLVSNPYDTHYLLGTVCGPNPYPAMNTFFQKIISEEIRVQMQKLTGGLPDFVLACVGGGSNAMGSFFDFLDEPDVQLIGVEAGGKGITETEKKCDHAARFQTGKIGIVEGMKSYFLQNEDGQLKNSHSISAGLDYSGVGPQISYLKKEGRIKMIYATDKKVLEAYDFLAKTEGVIGAMESCHAVAEAIKLAPTLSSNKSIVVNLSGRGDKDIFITAPQFNNDSFNKYLHYHLEKYEN